MLVGSNSMFLRYQEWIMCFNEVIIYIMWILKARREEQIKAAHDEAMFGASAVPPSVSSDSEPEPDSSEKKSSDGDIATSLFSENVNNFRF